ncbi:MAG: 3-hydroxybutyrate dehydrogenase [Conexivisphaerales archaeon]
MKGRVAIVTGGGSGIGFATTMALSSAGAKVSVADIDEVSGALAAKKAGGIFVRADLTKQDDCKRVVEETFETYQRIDILVNNAGFQHISPISDFPEAKWKEMLDLMLTAPFLLTKYSWKYMVKQRFGRIVNISSIHGLIASPYKAAYVAAKHGLNGLTKCTALEGAAYGITANSICPSYVRTPLVDKQIEGLAKANHVKKESVLQDIILKEAAIKRLIEPEEIADLVLYLCSDSTSSVTGSTWTIDLGWTAQ